MTDHFEKSVAQHNLQVRSCPLESLVQVSLWRDNVDEVGALIAQELRFSLPQNGRSVSAMEGGFAYRIAPERLLLISDADADLFNKVLGAVTLEMAAVSDIGHSRARLILEGEDAQPLLARLVPLDFGPAGLLPGQYAQSFLHDVNLLIHRQEEHLFNLLVPLSFSKSAQEWIAHAHRLMQY